MYLSGFRQWREIGHQRAEFDAVFRQCEDHFEHDRNQIKKLLSSTSQPSRPYVAMRGKVRRGVSSLMDFLKSKNEYAEPTTCENDFELPTTEYTTEVEHDFAAVARPTNPVTMQINRTSQLPTLLSLTKPSADCVDGHTLNTSSSQSCSNITLRRKLSTKILMPFSNSPTVVVRPQLRDRPSFQTLGDAKSSGGSSPSTPMHLSGSTIKHDGSTPRTSEGTVFNSLDSVRHYNIEVHEDHETVFPLDQSLSQRKLSTIPEIETQTLPSIKTVEATASAKLVLKSHVLTVANGLEYSSKLTSLPLSTMIYLLGNIGD